MAVIADLNQLVAEGILSPAQAGVIRARARRTMVDLLVALLLCGGALVAAAGLVAWLAEPVRVALAGLVFLMAGIAVLSGAGTLWRMFGHAAALIGVAMMAGGAVVEAFAAFEPVAAGAMLTAMGAMIALPAALVMKAGGARLSFLSRFLLLTGLALHLAGPLTILRELEAGGLAPMLFSLWATLVILGAGWATDLRLITALAIVPFAQMLHTGTDYFHAVFVFYSEEPTLSILQMTAAAALAIWLAARTPERLARHATIFALMAFIVANLCFFVGALWGDVVGEDLLLWRVWDTGADGFNPAEAEAARAAYEARALIIPAGAFAIAWALLLAVCAALAARHLQRGLFNVALTFGVIHAYTQLFDRLGSEPLVFVIGGLVAVPLAWGIWRLNQQFG